ncbi:MAG: hypothetical protein K2O71_02235, partial [Lachnospiraceae bacterium]|nr:hypothetical protein [Lachnospiraceae bacterium]
MKNSKTFAKLLCLLLSVECLLFPAAAVKADTMPYDTYSYDWWGEDVLQPPAYLYAEELSYLQSGTNLKNPQDLFIRDNILYIADMDNNRIVALDTFGAMLFELSTFASEKNAE